MEAVKVRERHVSCFDDDDDDGRVVLMDSLYIYGNDASTNYSYFLDSLFLYVDAIWELFELF